MERISTSKIKLNAGKASVFALIVTLLLTSFLAIKSITTVFASVSSYSAADFSQYCAQNSSSCNKNENPSNRSGNVSCPNSNQIISSIYVHAGNGQTVWQLPDSQFLYSYSNNDNTVTVNALQGTADLSWIAVICNNPSPTPTESEKPTPTATPTTTPTTTPTATPTATPRCSPTPTPTMTPTPTPTATPVITPTATPVATPTSTPTCEDQENCPSPTATPVETPAPTPTPTSNPPGGCTENCGGNAPVCTAPKPGTPTITNITQHGTSVTLTWTAVANATYYSIQYGDRPGYQYGVANVGNVTNYTINDLKAGTVYHYAANAVNDCMPGDPGTFYGGTGGQVLGASTMAGTGTFTENLYLAIMAIGGIITLFGFKNAAKAFKKA